MITEEKTSVIMRKGVRQMTTGQKIRHFRKKKGLRQYELAEKVGYGAHNQTRISFFELGKSEPSLKTLRKIATALEVEVSDLIGD